MTNDTRHAHRRSRYLRAFLQWHQAARTRLPVRLVRAHRAGPRCREVLRYRFDGLPPELQVSVRKNEIGIGVFQHGEWWDFLVFFESQARHDPDGYRCQSCEGRSLLWPTREALWIEHDFEAFMSWLHKHLLTAQALEIHSVKGGTWAALVPADAAPKAESATLVQRWPLTFPRL